MGKVARTICGLLAACAAQFVQLHAARGDSLTLNLDEQPNEVRTKDKPDVVALFRSAQPGTVYLTLESPGLSIAPNAFIADFICHLDPTFDSRGSSLSISGSGLAGLSLTTERGSRRSNLPESLSLLFKPEAATRGRDMFLTIRGFGGFGKITANSFDETGRADFSRSFVAAALIESPTKDCKRPRERVVLAINASTPAITPNPAPIAGAIVLLSLLIGRQIRFRPE